jgi:transposase
LVKSLLKKTRPAVVVYRVGDLRQRNRVELEIAKHREGAKGFLALARRWVAGRTFARLSFYRRLSKDSERLPETSETFIRIAMTRLTLARLTRRCF